MDGNFEIEASTEGLIPPAFFDDSLESLSRCLRFGVMLASPRLFEVFTTKALVALGTLLETFKMFNADPQLHGTG
jgi:hypothetical protein